MFLVVTIQNSFVRDRSIVNVVKMQFSRNKLKYIMTYSAGQIYKTSKDDVITCILCTILQDDIFGQKKVVLFRTFVFLSTNNV